MTRSRSFRARVLTVSTAAIGVVSIAGLLSRSPQAQVAGADGEWRSYGGTNASLKYSPLAQIDKDTVKSLRIAWRQSAVPEELRIGRDVVPIPANYQATPIMVDGLLYVATGDNSIAALDPGTGRVVWTYMPRQVRAAVAPAPATAETQAGATTAPPTARISLTGSSPSRGVAFWSDGRSSRIIAVSRSSLVAVDAKTGLPVAGFGDNGEVDLRRGYDRPVEQYGWKGIPLIVRDVVIVGSEGLQTGNPSGGVVPQPVRGYDVRTGRLLWTFNTIPKPGEYGSETWRDGAYTNAAGAGVWGVMSADEELGYVYLPVEAPAAMDRSSDSYGGARPGANLFGNSLVCLDARTGKRIWHFQVIHHDLWDWDLGAAPILLDITVDGRRIKAVAQPTKYSILWVFDRVTGKPVWPVREVSVPKGDVPGEWYSPTQPLPTKPPRYDQFGVTVDDLIDFTPQLREQALKVLNQYRYGPLFVPPSVANGPDGKQGTLMVPGTVSNVFNGAGADPETGILYVPSAHSGIVIEMVPSESPDAFNFGGRQKNLFVTRRFTGPRGGAIVGAWPDGPEGLPLFKPPYGRLVAIDLNKGELKWTVPNGDGPRDHPAIRHLNLPPLGQPGRAAPLVTKTLVFMGEGGNSGVPALPPFGGGKKFRAFDKNTGAVVWETELPGGTTGAPMTYMHDGRQYIVVAVGWQGMGGELVALTAGDTAAGAGVAPPTAASQAAAAPFAGNPEAGQTHYAAQCAVCHGPDLRGGGLAPSLVGDDFIARWKGQTADALYDRIRVSMPPSGPGPLDDNAYRHIVAFLLRENGVNAADGRF